jgi:hypothetical protein
MKFFLIITLVGCGGGSSSDPIISAVTTPAVITPVETTPVVTTPVYGLFDIILPSNQTITIFLDEERSYIFSVAENNLPVSEFMCLSQETLEGFSENLSAQTLNFTCGGSSNLPVSLTISLNNKVSIKYIHDTQFDYELPLDSIVNISTPNFRDIDSGDYLLPVRNDINISRSILASPRTTYIDFSIFSRDWPIGGNCLASKNFKITDLSSIIVNDTNEYASIPYSSTSITPAISGCSQKVLPMPSISENLDTHIYTLVDGSYFIVFEQQNFITMGRLYLNN